MTLRSGFRRVPIGYALALLTLADVAFLFSRNAQWRGEWLWTVDWVAGGLFLVGPLAAGLIAWQVGFQDRLLGDATALPGFGRRTTWAVLGSGSAAILAAHLATVLLAGLVTFTSNPGLPGLSTVHVGAQFVILLGYCAAGFMAGTLVRHPLTSPVTVGVLFLIPMVLRQGPLSALVDYGGATATLTGLAPRWSFDVAHSAIGLGLFTAAAGVGFSATSWRRGQRVDRTAMSLVSLGLLIVLAAATFLLRSPGEAFVAGSSAVDCQPTQTTHLCLVSESEHARLELTGAVDDINAALQPLDVAPAPAIVQVIPGAPLPPELTASARPLVLNPETVGQSRMDTMTLLIPYVIIDRRCLAQASEVDLTSLEGASNYLLWQLTQSPEVAALADVKALQGLDEPARTARLSAIFNAAGSCTLDDLSSLSGTE